MLFGRVVFARIAAVVVAVPVAVAAPTPAVLSAVSALRSLLASPSEPYFPWSLPFSRNAHDRTPSGSARRERVLRCWRGRWNPP